MFIFDCLTINLQNSRNPQSHGNWILIHSSVIRQKGESQNGCFKKKMQDDFSEKQTFLTSKYARVGIHPYLLLPTIAVGWLIAKGWAIGLNPPNHANYFLKILPIAISIS